MARPLCDSEFIYGLHDSGGEEVMRAARRPGWIVFSERIGSNPQDFGSRDYSQWSDADFGVIVRLNHGYEPEGTIPVSDSYQDFARRCGNFVRNSSGCHIWIIGNEMNFAAERPAPTSRRAMRPPRGVKREADEPAWSPRELPDRFSALQEGRRSGRSRGADRDPITPEMYARCYRLCREAIHAQPGHEDDQVLVGPVAPWNNQTTYPGNESGDWVKYFADILANLGATQCDGFALHIYTHGSDPALITSDAVMEAPFQDRHYHFAAYRDFMQAVPQTMRHLPAYITETGQIDEWADVNSGWVKAAYEEIESWNKQKGNQQIRALTLYRWSRHDKWYIDGKPEVVKDFKEALGKGYKWRVDAVKPTPPQLPEYKAAFVQGGGLHAAEAGQTLVTHFVVRNEGAKTWSKGGRNPVRLGSTWQNQAGEPVTVPPESDFRTPLPKDVKAGETVTIQGVKVMIPLADGNLRLTWDLVEEGVTWFAEQGSSPFVEIVNVTPSPEMQGYFEPVTKKWVRGPFLEAYRQYGLEITGYPLTDQYVDEDSHLNTQYFQRVALEEPKAGQIRLRLVGQEALTAQTEIDGLNADIARLTADIDQLHREIQALKDAMQNGGDGSVTLKPAIEDITDQLPRTAKDFKRRQSSAIKYLVINHTGGPADLAIDKLAGYHRDRGYPGLAYHYVIDGNGAIMQTNPWTDTVSDQGYLGEGLNIAIAGKFDNEIPNEKQLRAAAQLCAWLLVELRLLPDAIQGVSEFVSTGSPGAQWLKGQRYKDKLLAYVEEAVDEATKPGTPKPPVDPKPDPTPDPVEPGSAAELTALREKLQRRESELAEAQTRLAAMERELAGRDDRLASMQSQLDQQVAKVAAQQAEINRLKAALQQGGGELPAAPPLTAPAMHDITDQLVKHETLRYATRKLDKITHICIHHSAAPATIPIENVAEYHVKDRGWPGIGYHYYIKPDGATYQTNRMETISYQVSDNNSYTLGVCVAGDFTYQPPPDTQVDAAARLVAWLMQELDIPDANIMGHKEFPKNDTSCPGETWLKKVTWKNTLLDKIRSVRDGQNGYVGQRIGHYVLFWQRTDTWAQQDWEAAETYIGRFRPTAGFSVDDAKTAEYVTIVGGDAGVSFDAERTLQGAGCKVERLAGKDFADTKRILDDLAASGRRFLTFPG
ncbi:MAG: N-acetylmuramoyl-L-alanine amidase [Anaerolineae bacterium]|nr:N-acetylmuramoyl-L-alanine amidase [Anaerolineae bacterium]